MDDDRPNAAPSMAPDPTQKATPPATPADAAREAEALEAFFHAARDEQGPSAAFLSAVLADAAEVSAGRATAEAAGTAHEPPSALTATGGLWHALSALVGGWRGGAALTACALIGFLIGANGYGQLPTDAFDTAANATVSDNVSGFYDLAALEQ